MVPAQDGVYGLLI